jgi:hypothetical protein
MGQQYLMDTNAVIDYIGQRLPDSGEKFIDNLPPRISVITRIELIGWFGVSPKQLASLLLFTANVHIYLLEENVILKAIELRQKYKIKTPDAIIAATALVHDYSLITNNVADFKIIPELSLINPHKIA